MTTSTERSLRLWLEMVRVTMPLYRRMDKRFRSEFGQSLVRFDVMSQLDRFGGNLTVSALAGHLLASTSGNISMLLDRMTAEGLIVRQFDKSDRRRTMVNLTDKGRDLFKTMAAAHAQWADEAFMQTNEDTQTALLDSLVELRKHM
jgi:DNA-binding MarR family transcriptional regulator